RCGIALPRKALIASAMPVAAGIANGSCSGISNLWTASYHRRALIARSSVGQRNSPRASRQHSELILMTKDIVARLRAADADPRNWRRMYGEAADEIEALRADLG